MCELLIKILAAYIKFFFKFSVKIIVVIMIDAKLFICALVYKMKFKA